MGDVQWWGLIVTFLLGAPFAIMNVYKYFKERREDADAEAVKAASPELMVVGVAGSLAASLLEALRASQDRETKKDAAMSALEQKYIDLEQKYWAERSKRLELEEKLIGFEREMKDIRGRLDK